MSGLDINLEIEKLSHGGRAGARTGLNSYSLNDQLSSPKNYRNRGQENVLRSSAEGLLSMSPHRYFQLEKELNKDRDIGSNLLIRKRPFEAPLVTSESVSLNKNSYKLPELRMYPKNSRLD